MSAVRYDGIHCHFEFERPAPGVVVMRISGRDVGELGDAPLQELTRDFAGGRPVELFVDARNVQGASIDVSNEWARWLRANRSRFATVNMLTGSRYIEITAGFVRRFAEMDQVMRIYTDGAAFDEALAASVAAAC